MSTWLQENIIKNLNAFQLVFVVLAYFILTPFVTVAVALLDGTIIPTMEQAVIFIALCLVIIVFLLVAIVVYRKDKEAKIETAKVIEFTPTEKFTLKQTAGMIYKLLGEKGGFVPPAEDTGPDLSRVDDETLTAELRKRLEAEEDG
jgi:hypothetical protein